MLWVRDLEIPLTIWEFRECTDVALKRMATSATRSLNHSSTYRRNYLERLAEEVTGCCSELAICKALGVEWTKPIDTFHRIPDVGNNIESRGTERDNGCLILRDNDPDDRWYVLVTGAAPTMTIRGRMLGSAGKVDRWQRNPHGHRPAWFVPQHALSPIPLWPNSCEVDVPESCCVPMSSRNSA